MPVEVNTIYVSAASAADISAVSGEISRAQPSATVTTSSSVARRALQTAIMRNGLLTIRDSAPARHVGA
jgi:hypothetical protein